MDSPIPEDGYTLGHENTITQGLSIRTVKRFAAFLLPDLNPGMSLLDCGCGCGPGSTTIELAQRLAPGQVTGIDIGAESVKQAQALARDLNVSNVSFQVASIYELPFPDNSFDAVFTHVVLAHLKRTIAGFAGNAAGPEIERFNWNTGCIGSQGSGTRLPFPGPVLRDSTPGG